MTSEVMSSYNGGMHEATVGALIRGWRTRQRLSQLELAEAAEVSTRHLSCIETGRAQPSREMVLCLARVLQVPPRDRNVLLQAAGFVGLYRETPLDSDEMTEMRRALTLILRQAEPFGAVALDRRWDVVMANAAFLHVVELLGVRAGVAPLTLTRPPRPNAIDLLLGEDGMRRFVTNWPAVAGAVRARLEREAPVNPAAAQALERARPLLASATPPGGPGAPLLIPLELALGPVTLRLFSTIATLGTAVDLTLQELRIESFHAADEESERVIRQLGAAR
jgi:transcriptional regulator with XRE-family HTH domain